MGEQFEEDHSVSLELDGTRLRSSEHSCEGEHEVELAAELQAELQVELEQEEEEEEHDDRARYGFVTSFATLMITSNEFASSTVGSE